MAVVTPTITNVRTPVVYLNILLGTYVNSYLTVDPDASHGVSQLRILSCRSCCSVSEWVSKSRRQPALSHELIIPMGGRGNSRTDIEFYIRMILMALLKS